MKRLLQVVWVFLLLATAAWAETPQRSIGQKQLFGLVIGSNLSDDPEVQPLRYADDDAVQNAKLLTDLGAQVVLLVDLDEQSKALHEDLSVTSPTRAAVNQALDRLNGMMAEARSKKIEPILYLFYSGHGDVENNRGYVHLRDARLWRDDLLALLGRSEASENHVIIDACKSYFLVFDRGAGGERTPVSGALVLDTPTVPDNTGFLLSTSAANDSHEWEAFQSGVFSHEVRSALRGAADHDLDGHVTYQEVSAFVWAANAAIPNQRYRPNLFTRAPGQGPESSVLLRLSQLGGDRLVVGPGEEGHLYIEDEDGLRLADFHPAASQQVVLVLPNRRPLFVRRMKNDQEVELPEGEKLLLAELTARTSPVGRRGAEHVAFRRLFDRSFSAETMKDYQSYRLRSGDALVVTYATDWTWARHVLGIASLGIAMGGGTLTGLALSENQSVEPETSGVERQRVNDRIERYNTIAVICYAVAATGIAAYLTWTLWPEEEVELQVLSEDQPSAALLVRF